MSAILVPVDGSVHALKALHVACDLADKYGGRIALLHVLDQNRPAAEILRLPVASTFGAEMSLALKNAAIASGKKPVDRSASEVPEKVLKVIGGKILSEADAKVHRRGLDTTILEIEQGDPAEIILLAIKQTGANTIVMGCRGQNGSESSSFGSVSQRVFQMAECTCISVK